MLRERQQVARGWREPRNDLCSSLGDHLHDDVMSRDGK